MPYTPAHVNLYHSTVDTKQNTTVHYFVVNCVKPGGAEHNFNVKYQQNSFTILYSSFKA